MIDFNVSFSHASNNLARKTKLEMFACPSDLGLVENEWHSPTWARVRANYVVNFGNTTYGQLQKAGVPFLGAPFAGAKKTPTKRIVDGMSKTLMMSETKVVPANGPGWGGPLSDFSTALGGQSFTGWLPPNSPVPDEIARLILPAENYESEQDPASNTRRSLLRPSIYRAESSCGWSQRCTLRWFGSVRDERC